MAETGADEAAMMECYRGVVHPWLCDAMGHMTTRHDMAMFDDGSYHLLAALGFEPRHLAEGVASPTCA